MIKRAKTTLKILACIVLAIIGLAGLSGSLDPIVESYAGRQSSVIQMQNSEEAFAASQAIGVAVKTYSTGLKILSVILLTFAGWWFPRPQRANDEPTPVGRGA